MNSQTVEMPPQRKKKKPGAKPDESYRKSFKPCRVRIALAEAATARAEELAMDFTEYVNGALRMRLEAEGRWPPKPDAGKK